MHKISTHNTNNKINSIDQVELDYNQTQAKVGELTVEVAKKEAEIAEMPVSVADHGIKNQHIVEGLDKLLALAPIIRSHGIHAAADHPANGKIRVFLAGKQLAGGTQLPLPLGQAVIDGVDAHSLGDLGGVELGIGLVAGVVGPGGAALVEQDPAVLSAPALGEHTVGGELGAGGQGGSDAAAVAGEGDQRQDLAEAILVEIVLGKGPLEALLDHPVAVVQGQALGDMDDAKGAVQIQSALAQEAVDKCPVLGDRPVLQPLVQPVIAQFQIQRKHISFFFVDPSDLQLRCVGAVDDLEPQQ